MKKIVLCLAFLLIIISPSNVLASPGALDQYGGHYCQADCYVNGLNGGEYHFHNIVNSPNYFSNYLLRNQVATPTAVLFYQPEIPLTILTTAPDSLADVQLIENGNLDVSYCQQAKIFSGGVYDKDGFVRVKPVCFNTEILVKANSSVKATSYYKEIPAINTAAVLKVYHYMIASLGKKVFTDRPEINELKGLLIQGETDSILYYVYPDDYTLSLRKVTPAKAAAILGENYQGQVVYFNDSIIYSYKIGLGLN